MPESQLVTEIVKRTKGVFLPMEKKVHMQSRLNK